MTVFVLAGLPGSGKSTAAAFFKNKGFPVVRMGEATDEELKKKKLSKTEYNEKTVRDVLRATFGDTVYAAFALSKLHRKRRKWAIIEGIRSIKECEYFLSHLSRVRLIWIDSEKAQRYHRLLKRKNRKRTLHEAIERDQWELHTMDILQLRKRADYRIENNHTIQDFYRQLMRLIRPMRPMKRI